MGAASNIDFPTTRWSLIEALQSPRGEHRRQALEELARLYRPAAYAYLRTRGYPEHVADDLVQTFFSDVVLPRQLFARADRQRGPLRALVLTALMNLTRDQRRRDAAAGPKKNADAATHAGPGAEPAGVESAAVVYHQQWASAILRESVERCRQELETSRHTASWEAFDARVLRPVVNGSQPRAYDRITREGGFGSQAAAVSAVHRVRQRLQRMIRLVIGEQVPDPALADEEFRMLARILGGDGHPL